MKPLSVRNGVLVVFSLIAFFLPPLQQAISGNMSNASLKGTYLMAELGFDNLHSDAWSGLFEVTFDGNGSASYRDLSSGETGTATYNVTSEGVFNAISPNSADIGIVNYDGTMFTFVDTNESDALLSIKVGINIDRKKALLSNDVAVGRLGGGEEICFVKGSKAGGLDHFKLVGSQNQ